jgi:hypothetical protein
LANSDFDPCATSATNFNIDEVIECRWDRCGALVPKSEALTWARPNLAFAEIAPFDFFPDFFMLLPRVAQ